VDYPEKGAEDTPFPGAPKNTATTASTATGPDDTTRTCPHGGDKHTDEEWEEF
jgi:hypothetical protein